MLYGHNTNVSSIHWPTLKSFLAGFLSVLKNFLWPCLLLSAILHPACFIRIIPTHKQKNKKPSSVIIFTHTVCVSVCVFIVFWSDSAEKGFSEFPPKKPEGLYLSAKMVAKAEKTGGGEAAAAAVAVVSASNHQSRRRRSFNKPSWLLCTIADLDERMKIVTRKIPNENSPDSFAARANSYYHERPQLLAILHDLYNGYLSLADRYCQVLAKNQHQHERHSRCSSPITLLKLDETTQPDEGDTGEVIDSDAESSLSFQPPTVPPIQAKEMDADMIIADLVMKTVEYDIIKNELAVVEKRWGESSRKMELQKNLLDVLDSERLILLNDNATLGYRVTALVEENKGLASESMFLKRKAAELARCVLKTREDHRVCMLSRKIEDLQGQIFGLEKRNKEYYEQLVKQEEKNTSKGMKSKGGEQVNLEDCFQAHGGGAISLTKCFSFNVKRVGDQNPNVVVEGRRVSKLWDKVKKFDLFQCGPQFSSATS